MYYKADMVNIEKAKDALNNNFIVHSTDTLNSLSADATSDNCIQKVIDFKNRCGPFSIILNSINLYNSPHLNITKNIICRYKDAHNK